MPRSRKKPHKRSRQSESVRTIRYPKYTPTIKDLEEPLSFMDDPDFDYSVEDSWKKNFHLDGTIPKSFPENISKLLWTHPGEHDEENWYAIGQLDNKQFFFFKAGCDYTGFDCQGFIEIYTDHSYQQLLMFAMDEADYKMYVKNTVSRRKKSSRRK